MYFPVILINVLVSSCESSPHTSIELFLRPSLKIWVWLSTKYMYHLKNRHWVIMLSHVRQESTNRPECTSPKGQWPFGGCRFCDVITPLATILWSLISRSSAYVSRMPADSISQCATHTAAFKSNRVYKFRLRHADSRTYYCCVGHADSCAY